jgi:hypothetical protein
VIEIAMQKALLSRLEHNKKPFDKRLADIFILKTTLAKSGGVQHRPLLAHVFAANDEK